MYLFMIYCSVKSCCCIIWNTYYVFYNFTKLINFEMQKIEITRNHQHNNNVDVDQVAESTESIYGQHVPRMRLLKVNYVNPNFNFTEQNSSLNSQVQLSNNELKNSVEQHRYVVYKKSKCPQDLKVTKNQKGNIENIRSCNIMNENEGTTDNIEKSIITRASTRKTICDTWNVKLALKNGLNQSYISGIVPRSSRIEQIEKLNKQTTVMRSKPEQVITNKKSSSDISKIDKIFEQAKTSKFLSHRPSSDKKVKKLDHGLQFKCQCKGNVANKRIIQLPGGSTDEKVAHKTPLKIVETQCVHNSPLSSHQHKQTEQQQQTRPNQVIVEPKKYTKRTISATNRCHVERINLKKTSRQRKSLLISNHVETNTQLFSQPNEKVIINEKKLEQNNRKTTTCGYKNCTFLNCPISNSTFRCSSNENATPEKYINDVDHSYDLSEKRDNILIKSKKLENKVKVVKTGSKKSEDVTGISLMPTPDKMSDHNDVHNFSGKNLTKATTDKVLLSSQAALNNIVNKNSKVKTDIDVNLKNNENRKFNDLKSVNNAEHRLKIFVKNSSLSNNSLGSDFASSTESDKDDGGYYDQVASAGEDDTFGDNKLSSSNCSAHENIFSTKLGCDGAIFWNNCYFYDDNYCASCQLSQETRTAKRSDCICFCSPKKKPDVHDMRPRSMEVGLDSGVSISGDTGSSPDSDTLSHHLQSQADLEARRLKRGHVLTELLETERIYVTEMNSILKGYRDQMVAGEKAQLFPPCLQGKEDILFGNLHELYTFHNEVFLKDLENCISTTELVALCFVQRRDTFYRLYSFYCQNIPRSERLRETLVDAHLFLQECQKRLGHKLPLAAYLLKPVQRITKYQLLLKDLLRFSDSGTCTKELQKALECMLIVLKCVNDSMHQIAITGFPADLSQQGELLLQDSFQVWTESKKDIRLRLKTQHRHIFLYQKAMLFCKPASKTGHNKSTYQYKHYLKMSQIGLTESVRGDTKRFEVWLQARQEVHTIQAPTIEIKNKWVSEIKRVLLNQLEELKGEKIKQYGLNHRSLRQTVSWDTPTSVLSTPQRALSCDTNESNRNSNGSDECPVQIAGISSSSSEKDNQDIGWSSDYSNSEDELSIIEDNSTPGSRFIALADYCAVGHSEVSMKEGDTIELLKVGCAGWWFVKVLGANAEGWTPAAYLEPTNRKTSRCSSRNQDRIN